MVASKARVRRIQSLAIGEKAHKTAPIGQQGEHLLLLSRPHSAPDPAGAYYHQDRPRQAPAKGGAGLGRLHGAILGGVGGTKVAVRIRWIISWLKLIYQVRFDDLTHCSGKISNCLHHFSSPNSSLISRVLPSHARCAALARISALAERNAS